MAARVCIHLGLGNFLEVILESVHVPAFSLAGVQFLASFAGNAINDATALTGHIAF